MANGSGGAAGRPRFGDVTFDVVALVASAGGTVLVQSPGSAEHPGMPTAVIESGVADLVLPLSELGRVIADVVIRGGPPQT